jgi:hypothetical protein
MTTIAQTVAPDESTFAPIADRLELPWFGASSRANVQDMLNENCVSCHDGGASDPYAGRSYMVEVTTMEGEMLNYTIPYLLLTDTPIEIYYEEEVVSYPASYVTLLYPSAMMGDVTITGDAPPEWVVPGSARGSRLVEAVNMPAADDASVLAWTGTRNVNVGPMHPEDQGVTISREDRLILARISDLGGQYYTRWNNDAYPFATNPTP